MPCLIMNLHFRTHKNITEARSKIKLGIEEEWDFDVTFHYEVYVHS